MNDSVTPTPPVIDKPPAEPRPKREPMPIVTIMDDATFRVLTNTVPLPQLHQLMLQVQLSLFQQTLSRAVQMQQLLESLRDSFTFTEGIERGIDLALGRIMPPQGSDGSL